MRFEPENSLEVSLLHAANHPKSRPQFYRDLCEADIFLLPENQMPEGGVYHLNDATRLMFSEEVHLQLRPIHLQGKSYIPFFSSLKQLQNFTNKDAEYVSLKGLTFLKSLGDEELLLNPGSEFCKPFTCNEIAAIINGSLLKEPAQDSAQLGNQSLIGEPVDPPTALIAKLARVFRDAKTVQKAYLAHYINNQDTEKPRTIIGIETSGDWEVIVARTSAVLSDADITDSPIDFMRLTGSEDLFEAYLVTRVKPFYVRKKWGIF